MGRKGQLPPIFTDIEVEYTLFPKNNNTRSNRNFKEDEHVLLNIGSTTTGSVIPKIEENILVFDLIKPVCSDVGERIAISKKINNHWRLIGHGVIKGGVEIEPSYE
ncbi:Eukaryotic translation initiation factor 2 subunit gamma [Nosema bombycis CQ1]|uniref:Eukaryotic translation initiation factor 2 subunit gamma n=1 Tax=Nosema bombycis (strain CQ1 / CVCC 102059) TaxID=578461 RepID=R0KVU2_NOSB1|nr:Eukaryotic translation initiation factor 2 subunit gamma [Nosema bombycis CQ1]|eukprot:EOB14322.1 Eukaryotic translation initiation factor 2 subunit gamma [Nosema bombycis CQ1]